MSVYFRLHLPRYSESTRSLKSHGLVHLQLYPHHTPDAVTSLSPADKEPQSLQSPCNKRQTEGLQPQQKPLVSQLVLCFNKPSSLTTHLPQIKGTTGHFSSSFVHLPASASHNTLSPQQYSRQTFCHLQRCVSLKSFHEVSTAPSRSCRENSSKFTNRLGHRTWQQTTCTQEKKNMFRQKAQNCLTSFLIQQIPHILFQLHDQACSPKTTCTHPSQLHNTPSKTTFSPLSFQPSTKRQNCT